MKLRSEIKAQARNGFTSKYGTCIGAIIVFGLLSAAASSISFGLGVFFLVPPLFVGYAAFNLNVYRGQQPDVADIFAKGFADYWNKVAGMLLMWVFTFLWSLLLIIPGIVKALAYSMTPYILAETDVEASDALKLSMRMTKGHKGAIFVMILSFIGWWLLTILTFGLLYLLYSGPYFHASFAGLYDELKAEALRNGTIRPEEFVPVL